MKILYYDWDEFNGEDCRDAMRRLGHQVDTVRLELKGFDVTPEMESTLRSLINKSENGKRYYDFLYSFDYFPNLSVVCQKYGMPYVSWVFDCPHYTLDSHTANNDVNKIYVFDKMLCRYMQDRGVKTIDYSPLGVNDIRLRELCKQMDGETGGQIIYQHDVCFIGNLYDNEYNFYDQMQNFPPLLKEYIDIVIEAQERIFGHDMFTDEKAITDDHIDELAKYVKFENSGNYELDYGRVLRDILRKKVTVNERRNILTEMGMHFDTVIYTMPGAKPIEGVCNLGIADYFDKMPRIFRKSKINLNITLRNILSGIPLRVIDVLAAGGFLITTYTEEIAEYFAEGEELVIAYTPEDMIQKAAYYLEHDEERKQIALKGQQKVFEKFAYTNLLSRICDIC
ncbi:glycosyltransferase family protein [Butyrivibrio fibrisolvens]|uniref:glycosyltransferase family protein n=1 Tax=Butyrivibrio fibrisolvens TaxID=831 RepID=UPI000413BB25|nr:glycosyltransferase [Butyrivibrio fibrisolvens]